MSRPPEYENLIKTRAFEAAAMVAILAKYLPVARALTAGVSAP